MKNMIFIILLLCCYIVYRSLTFAASQLASLILQIERNQVTYTTSYLPMSTCIEWKNNEKKFNNTQRETIMYVVSVSDGFSVSNSSFDYLYRDKKLGKLCASVVFTFYVQVPARTFLRNENCHLPRLISNKLIRNMPHIV